MKSSVKIATLMASGRLNGCSSCGGSTFTGLEMGESRADAAAPGLDGFFWFFTTFKQPQMRHSMTERSVDNVTVLRENTQLKALEQ